MKQNRYIKKIAVICFWVFIWQLLAITIGHSMLLPTPWNTLKTAVELALTPQLWTRAFFSMLSIVQGFILGILFGSIMAILATKFPFFKELFQPVILLAKVTPVASFVILALLWLPSNRLPIFISFLMVLPIIYTNIVQGILQTDPELLEMAQVFRLPFYKRLSAIYLPSVYPYLYTACSVALGLAWKSGIAAEVIALPKNSLGEALYQSKVFLDTEEMFAWTAVVILCSVLLEKTTLHLLKKFMLCPSKEESNATDREKSDQTVCR